MQCLRPHPVDCLCFPDIPPLFPFILQSSFLSLMASPRKSRILLISLRQPSRSIAQKRAYMCIIFQHNSWERKITERTAILFFGKASSKVPPFQFSFPWKSFYVESRIFKYVILKKMPFLPFLPFCYYFWISQELWMLPVWGTKSNFWWIGTAGRCTRPTAKWIVLCWLYCKYFGSTMSLPCIWS